MSNTFLQTLFVYGKEEDLKKFKEDLEIKGKSVFCVKKFNLQQVDELTWSDEFPDSWLFQEGAKEDSNIYCMNAVLKVKKDHLEYHFSPIAERDYPYLKSLSEAYKELNFKYIYEHRCEYQMQEVNISGGIVTKDYLIKVDKIYWKDDLYIYYEYGTDFLNNRKIYLHNATIRHEPDDDKCEKSENDDLFTFLGKLGEVYIKSDCREM